jgi:hypothetical protein
VVVPTSDVLVRELDVRDSGGTGWRGLRSAGMGALFSGG